jgi:putative ABC transport system substrate-binding protein
MTRRTTALALVLALAALTAPRAADAQPAAKTPRIGYLGGGRAGGEYLLEAFRQGLRDHEWIEGQNIAVEWRFTRGRDEKLPDLAADLVRLGVDVIVVGGGDPTIRAARAATRSIPIVMAVSVDPVGTGLIASLARPGGNVTGLSLLATGSAGKRLELLREVAPRASRVAVLWNSADPGKDIELRETRLAADRLGVTLQPVEVRGPSDFDRVFAEIARGRPDALIVFSEPLVLTHRRRIVEFAAKMRLPAISETKEVAEAGGLLTYGASLPALFRRAAYYVDRILKGADPATLPVEQPTTFELVVNLRTARALGVTIPQSVLLRADRVLE